MPMKIDWEQVDKAIKYVTMDEDGQIKGRDRKHFITTFIGSPNFPASALLEPYHPRDWRESRTTRPHEWDYAEMAERRQFGIFENSGSAGEVKFGHLIDYLPGVDAPFLSAEDEGCFSSFTPMTEPRPLEVEE